MMDQNIYVESLYDGQAITGPQKLVIKKGVVISIESCDFESDSLLSGLLVPGLIDIQVNGGGGYLFNQSPTKETLIKIAQAHHCFGTTGWLPTLITDRVEKMQAAADAVANVLTDENITTGILGIHFEGPHLSAAKKGVHQEQFIRALTAAEKSIFKRKDIGKIIVTLAPETVTEELIRELVAMGVIVSLGHSDASFEQAKKAIEAGASGFTHLFNAMSAFTSREPGMVGAALLSKTCYCGLILDGVHVHPSSVKLALALQKNIILVTDAMSLVGTDADSFEFFGETIKRDNDILTDKDGRLAGSMLDMATAVRNAQTMLSLSQEKAIDMATIIPAKFLGLDDQCGRIAVGTKANLVLLDKKGMVISSWIEGKKVF